MINRPVYLGISMRSRRQRRRLLVGYWLAMPLLAAAASFLYSRMHSDVNQMGALLAIGGLYGTALVFLGGAAHLGPMPDFNGDPAPAPRWVPLAVADRLLSRSAAGTGSQQDSAALDERDLYLRDAAHYTAYRILRECLLPVLIAAFVFFQYIHPHHEYVAVPVYACLVLVIFNLPQSLILWHEPDMEPLQ
ncbi:MAG TPA: hypothetical protein VG893_04065 [Terracidiphilus sp.]|nr:hypothetical protein [Terracidiphilus sp.]